MRPELKRENVVDKPVLNLNFHPSIGNIKLLE